MAAPQKIDLVKLFVAILYRDAKPLDNALERLKFSWGEVDFVSEPYPFDLTNYYEPEMGSTLSRRLVSLKTLVSPEFLPEQKLFTNQIEDDLAIDGKRTVNLDVGYLDHNKVVLASLKGAGQKIYLRLGVYADLAARYKSGTYQPFEWSFPDFKDSRYGRDLLTMRELFLAQRKRQRND